MFLGAWAALQAAEVSGQSPPENLRCLNCHGQPSIATSSREERATMLSVPVALLRLDPWRLFFDEEVFSDSAHAKVKCVDCHPGPEDLPHPPQRLPPMCSNLDCHPREGELYQRSVHTQPSPAPDLEMPHCWTCHGSHDILPPTTRKSRTYPLNVLAVCSGCHRQHSHASYRSGSRLPESGEELVQRFLNSEHGRGVQKSGLIVAATCPDCHRAHDVQPSGDPTSSVHANHLPQTCGRCHVGVTERYADSIHSRVRHDDQHKDKVPVCADCHSPHAVTRADAPAFFQDIVAECGTCHEDLYATYRESYHGQASRLGYRRAARCSDCHGAHDIQAWEDKESLSAVERKIAMCAPCHPGANENFVAFLPHADHRDRERHPLLFAIWMYFMIVITGTLTFFGLHTVLWWIRSLVDRLRQRGAAHAHGGEGRTFVRFRPVHRLTHALVITSFMGLTITGLPLKFSHSPWAVTLAGMLGGGHTAGILHRCFAVVMLVYVCIHATVVCRWFWTQIRSGKRGWLFGPESMLPRWKDVRDLLGMFRWFVGLGPLPKFDRWTYWEKFDYWADAFGTVVIGGSGLMLAFPITTSLILPGWMFNVAMIVHGYEALLAIAFIFTIHFFNAHLRIGKFPTDPVIFSGQISEHELREERPLEYERLQRAGRLDELAVPPRSRQFLLRVKVVGSLLLLIGISLVVLIVWAGLTSILG
jgi:cytochrome b subunit of formate dehydrogenase